MTGPNPDGQDDDLADLQAHVDRLNAELTGLRDQVDAIRRYLEVTVADQVTRPPADPAQSDPAQSKGKAVLRFVLTFPHSTPEQVTARSREVTALAAWVEDLLVPVYIHEARASLPWCAQWHQHPEAIARLHAAWMAWQALVGDPETGGAAGPSNWHRMHLDPMLAQLRSAHGPFSACMTDPDSQSHRCLPFPPVQPHPGADAIRAGRTPPGPASTTG